LIGTSIFAARGTTRRAEIAIAALHAGQTTKIVQIQRPIGLTPKRHDIGEAVVPVVDRRDRPPRPSRR
jgi:hypothetical protein